MKNYKEGKSAYAFANQIFPYCRSITGEGVRQTLNDIQEQIGSVNMNIISVPTGTKVFDWKIPKEWRIREAFIENERHERIIDFKVNNLHVMGYSTPIDKWVDLDELEHYLYTLPDQPEAIPYVTSYYKERFGFCMSERQKEELKPGKYHMVIDSEFVDGQLDYGEVILKGEIEEEVFFTTYICHPSMANNECSGIALLCEIVKYVASIPHRKYSYRFVFAPETIGAITYIDKNINIIKRNTIAGFNLSCVGDDGDYSIVHSKYSNTMADDILMNIIKGKKRFTEYSFLERGSDERQYNSPGVDMPIVGFSRTKYERYPEYHTSLDNMDFISEEGLQGSFDVLRKAVEIIENNKKYMVTTPCEPQLGKRGLYPTVSKKGCYGEAKIIRNIIAYADGSNDLIRLSDLIEVPAYDLIERIQLLEQNGILKEVTNGN